MFILIDKILRQLQFIIDKVIFFVFDWINVVMNRVQLINWNISKIIIFDRDSKFTFEFWIVFFHRLNTNLFMNNAYHSQTNDLFERSNQTIKIIFRYLITQYFDINWMKTLSIFQSYFNNVFNAIIDKSSNEIIYDFKIRDVFVAFIKQITFTNREFERFRHQKKSVDVTFYVMIRIKIIYDLKHFSLMFKSSEKIFFRLHKNYILFFKFNVKLFNQRINFFIVKRRVKRLAYELNLFFVWRVHSIIFVTQLKFVSFESNFYQRFKSNHSNALKVEDMSNTNFEKNYKIKRLINKRIRIYDKIDVTQYLIRWLDYELEFDEWKFLSILSKCIDFIEKYELIHLSAKIIKNKILNVVDVCKLDNLIELKKSIVLSSKKITFNESTQRKKSVVEKSIRSKKSFASSSKNKRFRDRSLKRVQSKKNIVHMNRVSILKSYYRRRIIIIIMKRRISNLKLWKNIKK